MGEAVQVWRVPLLISDQAIARYAKCLSADERARADRFRFEADRRKFVVARGTLRHLLGKRFGCAAGAIAFCYSKYGKPETSADPSGYSFHFNLSHSGEIALCALGGDRTVGIDIEKVKPIQRLDSLLERCLVAREKAIVKSQPIEQQPSAFLQHWTCKEAYLKAIGLGLSQSMTTVEVDLNPAPFDSPRFVHVPDECAAGWQLHRIAVPETYVAALVVAGESAVDVKDWQHSD
ncbi:4'-phosphopantetheinyl transferase superfamily protein [cf. Phormidesmis sp. LEGE 11477]|uniref:4'-phosphopantetheinyl transferase family protein n=1 Tax=cf. Phormidesmis sp. LEGE 11477 TaxID=1828680 RepID=UPI00187E89C1|nr:4'-phosphopantetheinyl transferase superfamily protein [cf. Phormidesmis sp. LEGE 11477]MBE9060671.1 4'-phosphopantetheinyl transferase superfamily protein [cf. Phormidesmis sp. LEGE 11477]